MLLANKTIIPESHRGLLFKNQQFVEVLEAGQHSFWDWKMEYEIHQVAVVDTLKTGVEEKWLHLIDLHPEAFAEHAQSWATSEDEVGLVYQDGVLKDIKAPAQRGAYWKTQRDIEVQLGEAIFLPHPFLACRQPLPDESHIPFSNPKSCAALLPRPQQTVGF